MNYRRGKWNRMSNLGLIRASEGKTEWNGGCIRRKMIEKFP